MNRQIRIALLILLVTLATPLATVEPAGAALQRNLNLRQPLVQATADDGGPAQVVPAGMATVSRHLQAQLAQSDGPISFLAIFKDQSEPMHVVAQNVDGQNRRAALYAYLTTKASRSQADLRTWLDSMGIPYRAFYIVNMIEIQGDEAVVEALRTRSDLDRLVANPVVDAAHMLAMPDSRHAGQLRNLSALLWDVSSLDQAPSTPLVDDGLSTMTTPYGITYTNAPLVWAKGYRGQGIVVAGQDTGVQWDHPALRDSYRGWDAGGQAATHAYNWFDAWDTDSENDLCTDSAQIPCDDDGHGTHTLGTMVGYDDGRQFAVGLAPDAAWIGCRNMLRGFGTPASYTACFEFFLAPYPQSGDPFVDGRPELAPNIINNSWGCPPYEGCDADTLRQVVETVRTAGIFVVSSAGNFGANGCSSVRDPIAIYDAAFSVGAHDSAGNIASFSSRGPVTIDDSNRLKPDMTAPGVGVLSAYPANFIFKSDEPYTTLSGTSMAAPHMAGTVALLWSAVPDLVGAIDETEQILLKSATSVLDNRCGEGSMGVTPNYTYGFGRLDALAAVEMALRPWDAVLEVVDAQGAPLAGVEGSLIDARTGFQYAMITGFNGQARLPRLYDGTYELQVNLNGSTSKVADIQLDVDGHQVSQEQSVNGRTVRYLMQRPEQEDPTHIYYLPIVAL